MWSTWKNMENLLKGMKKNLEEGMWKNVKQRTLKNLKVESKEENNKDSYTFITRYYINRITTIQR